MLRFDPKCPFLTPAEKWMLAPPGKWGKLVQKWVNNGHSPFSRRGQYPLFGIFSHFGPWAPTVQGKQTLHKLTVKTGEFEVEWGAGICSPDKTQTIVWKPPFADPREDRGSVDFRILSFPIRRKVATFWTENIIKKSVMSLAVMSCFLVSVMQDALQQRTCFDFMSYVRLIYLKLSFR